MSDEAAATAAAGWYAHPSMADTQQYWDGHRWTDHVAPGLPQRAQQAASQAEDEKHNGALTAAGLVLMVIFPIGGFIVGCILLAKKAVGIGVVIMLLSFASGYFWVSSYAEHQRQNCLTENLNRAMSGLPTSDCG